MSKKYLYGIIIVLILIVTGVIAIPSMNMGYCKNGISSKMYVRLGFISIPIPIERCDY